MLHAEINLITPDPPAPPPFLSYLDHEVRPVLEKQSGSLGLCLLASAGGVVLESFWASHEALRASEPAAVKLRGEMELRAEAPVTAGWYQISVFEYERPVLPHQAARLTQLQVTPSAVPDVAEVFGDTAVPWLAETPGFRGALLFADPASGRVVSQTVWRDQHARDASPSTAAVLRGDLLDSAHCVIGGVEDYAVVFSSARTA
jgi:hypothetical protein